VCLNSGLPRANLIVVVSLQKGLHSGLDYDGIKITMHIHSFCEGCGDPVNVDGGPVLSCPGFGIPNYVVVDRVQRGQSLF
jgi:hypothetical protein